MRQRWQGERPWRRAHLSQANAAARDLCAALCQWRSNAPPWVRAQGAHCGTVYTRSDCKPFAVPLAKGLRCEVPSGNAIGGPTPVTGEPLPEGPSPLEKHSPCPSAPSPKAPRHWESIRLALGVCARSPAVRALCAHPRHAIASAIGQAHRTNRALPHWLAKSPCLAHFLSLPPPPLQAISP